MSHWGIVPIDGPNSDVDRFASYTKRYRLIGGATEFDGVTRPSNLVVLRAPDDPDGYKRIVVVDLAMLRIDPERWDQWLIHEEVGEAEMPLVEWEITVRLLPPEASP